LILSIWRYCHLTLAIISTLFLIIASITGIILSFSPIKNEISQFNKNRYNDIFISELIDNLSKNFLEITEIKVDENDFLQVSAITEKGELETFYTNPETGEKIGNIQKEPKIFSLTRNIHRSLLMKKTGRLMIGIVSVLLFFMAFTGTFLIISTFN